MMEANELIEWLEMLAAQAPNSIARDAMCERINLVRCLVAENADTQELFDLQHTRTVVADKEWQEATGKHDRMPDLGELIEWLRSERDKNNLAAELGDHLLKSLRDALGRGVRRLDHILQWGGEFSTRARLDISRDRDVMEEALQAKTSADARSADIRETT